jgi:hypothetical protein
MITTNTQDYKGQVPLIGEVTPWGNWEAGNFYRRIENRDPKKIKVKLSKLIKFFKSERWGL